MPIALYSPANFLALHQPNSLSSEAGKGKAVDYFVNSDAASGKREEKRGESVNHVSDEGACGQNQA